MVYISQNFRNNPAAPVGKWACAPTSTHGPFDKAPTNYSSGADLCGQCVSYVKKVCASLPATSSWKKGEAVKETKMISTGTVIATFNAAGKYEGRVAIFVSKSVNGINVYDQWVSGGAPKAVGPRLIMWTGQGISNNGNNFYIVN
jgi:hypothetical protein